MPSVGIINRLSAVCLIKGEMQKLAYISANGQYPPSHPSHQHSQSLDNTINALYCIKGSKGRLSKCVVFI